MDWQKIILNYDEQSLAELANEGLLRRAKKQVEKNKVSFLSQEADKAKLESGGHNVSLFSAPLEKAQCTCSAVGTCVHILAAVLYIQQNPVEINSLQEEKNTDNPETDKGQNKVSVVEDLAQFEPPKIFKWAGKVATRKAAQLLNSEYPDFSATENKTNLEIQLNAEIKCRFMLGTGLDGIICDAPDSRKKAYISACLLYWWQSRGTSIQWPDEAEQVLSHSLTEHEESFLSEVKDQLSQLLKFGIMHVSTHTANRIQDLAWSIKSENLPRLNSMLLRIAGELTAIAENNAEAKPNALINQVVKTYLLCESLRLANTESNNQKTLASLRGEHRRSYQKQATGPLWLAGAYLYNTKSNARGLSLLFWDLETKHHYNMNLGRSGEAAKAFTPESMWQTSIAWNKGRAPNSLHGKILKLDQTKVSADGKISQSGESTLVEASRTENFIHQLKDLGFSSWKVLEKHLQQKLRELDTLLEPVILQAQSFTPFELNEHEQCWHAHAQDQEGRLLTLTYAVNALNKERIRQFNKLVEKSPKKIWAIISIPQVDGSNIQLSPVSALLNETDKIEAYSLDFHSFFPKEKRKLGSWLQELVANVRSTPNYTANTEYKPLLVLLDGLYDALQGMVELGLNCPFELPPKVKTLISQLSMANVPLIQAVVEKAFKSPTTTNIIQALYLLEQAKLNYDVMHLLRD